MKLDSSLRVGLVKPRAFGVPYHGILKDGEYLIPGGEVYNEKGVKIDHKRVICSGMDGSLFVLKPGISNITLTADEKKEEAKKGRVWRDYSLWNQQTGYIDGIKFGNEHYHTIYHDGKNLWGIYVEMYGNRLEVFVTELLARIDTTNQKKYPTFKRRIGRVNFIPDPQWVGGYDKLHKTVIIPHPNGKKFLANVYDQTYWLAGYCEALVISTGGGVIASKDSTPGGDACELINVCEVSFRGVGSTTPGNLGYGISLSSSTKLLQYSNIYTCYHTCIVNRPPAPAFEKCSGGTAKLMQIYDAYGAKKYIINYTADTCGSGIESGNYICAMKDPPLTQYLCLDSIYNKLLTAEVMNAPLSYCSCDYPVWMYGNNWFYWMAAPSRRAHPYGSAPLTHAAFCSYQPQTDTWATSNEYSVGWI